MTRGRRHALVAVLIGLTVTAIVLLDHRVSVRWHLWRLERAGPSTLGGDVATIVRFGDDATLERLVRIVAQDGLYAVRGHGVNDALLGSADADRALLPAILRSAVEVRDDGRRSDLVRLGARLAAQATAGHVVIHDKGRVFAHVTAERALVDKRLDATAVFAFADWLVAHGSIPASFLADLGERPDTSHEPPRDGTEVSGFFEVKRVSPPDEEWRGELLPGDVVRWASASAGEWSAETPHDLPEFIREASKSGSRSVGLEITRDGVHSGLSQSMSTALTITGTRRTRIDLVYPGLPADRAGLKPGDVILTVDRVVGISPAEYRRGEPFRGKKRSWVFVRRGTKELLLELVFDD